MKLLVNLDRKHHHNTPVEVKLDLYSEPWQVVDDPAILAKLGEPYCLCWTGGKDSSGYGLVKVEGRHQKAHRVAWELAHGSIPEGLQLDHLCRNRGCINPAHLELVTCRENVTRGLSCALKADATSEHPGVSWYKRDGKWKAQVVLGGRNYHLGYYPPDQEEQASRHYQSVIKALNHLESQATHMTKDELANALELAGFGDEHHTR